MEEQVYFGPSQTTDYLKCPTYWRLNKLWSLRLPWKPYLAIGAAFSDALAVFRLAPTEEGYAQALKAARAKLEERYEENIEWSLDGLYKLFEKGFDAALKKTVSEELENEDVVGTEKTIGAGRVDFISRLKRAKDLIVTDDKVSLQMRADYVSRNLVEVEQDWQLWDYAWRVGDFYGEAVKYMRRHLIILSPRASSFHQLFTITPEAVTQWFESAKIWWARMAIDKNKPLKELAMNQTQCINKYGKCSFYEACHTLLRDESKMETLYDRKER